MPHGFCVRELPSTIPRLIELLVAGADGVLDNLRYAVDVCLYTFPNASSDVASTSSPCVLDTNCRPLQSALEAGNLNPSNETEFQYCTQAKGAFQGQAMNNCVQCLQATPDRSYLSNCKGTDRLSTLNNLAAN